MAFKVLLIRPSSSTGNIFQKVSGVMPPLNLAYLGGYLKKKGKEFGLSIDVSILDLELVQLTIQQFREKLIFLQPNIIGFTVHTNSLATVIPLSKFIKKVIPTTRIILGGPHPTVEPESTLLTIPQVDFIACTEGEETLFDLINHLVNNDLNFNLIPGLCYRDAGTGKIVCNEDREFIDDLRSIGFPDTDLLDYEKYLKIPQTPGVSKPTANVFTARGCPFNCSFCASPVINRRIVRFFPIDMVVDEINYLKEKYRIEHVTFKDSNLTLNRNRAISLCFALIKANLGITWNCETRVNLVDPLLLKIMKASGCIKISFGVESGSPRILKTIDKGITIQQIRHAFQWCKQIGIQAQANFMTGFPTEDERDARATITLLKEIAPDYLFLSKVVPLPGTRIFTEFKKRGLITNMNQYEAFQFFYKNPAWKTVHFDAKDIIKLQRRIYRSYVFNFGYFFRMIKKIKGFGQLKYSLSAVLGFLDFLLRRQ